MSLIIVLLQLSMKSASEFIATFDPAAHVRSSSSESHLRILNEFHCFVLHVFYVLSFDETKLEQLRS